MHALLPLVPSLPLFGFVTLFVAGGALTKRWIALVGVGSVAIATILAFMVAAAFLASPQPYNQTLWQWIAIGSFTPMVGFYLDALSLVMMLIVAFVSLLIHLYSAEFMSEDQGYRRYFACMNLFVASMLVLVLSDNLLFLYLGWEGVGLCSYLLIGFWWQDAANGAAARKAFIVTRIGDVAMAIGVFVLFINLETLDIQHLMRRAAGSWAAGSPLPVLAAALVLGGAIGKSAQLPLQVWLPDAMAGPAPVSALIHAATMVTAGVYLIARLHVLYELAPVVQFAVAFIGATTLLVASFSAINQSDLKRILAYSTISQIGYMFLALGVGAWIAAIFHFMTHAFFKALLFLSAGVVIQRLDGEHDISKMGGLRRRLPLAFWSFLAGSASLAALPLVTAGFYSKDMILAAAWSNGPSAHGFWAVGLVGAFLTSFYIFRAVFKVFFGEIITEPHGRVGSRIAVPLVILTALALVGGLVEIPPGLGDAPNFSRMMNAALPATPEAEGVVPDGLSAGISGLVAVLGVLAAYLAFQFQPGFIQTFAQTPAARALTNFWAAGWGFDWLYECLFVRPFLWFARVNQADFVDALFSDLAILSQSAHRLLSLSQTGRIGWYAAGITVGAVMGIAIMVLD